MNKKTTKFLLVVAITIVSVFFAHNAKASLEDIVFPVKELGNCGSKEACRTYCDSPDNFQACFSFAKKNNLVKEVNASVTEDQIAKFAKYIKSGDTPGGCNSHSTCENYCSDVTNVNECVAWAEKNDVLPKKELADAKKIKAVLDRGVKMPGGCNSRKTCEEYCGDVDKVVECLDFVEKADLIPEAEADLARKIIDSIKKGETPGKCRSKMECEDYCFNESHLDECLNFAEKTGLDVSESLMRYQQFGGKGPGNCQGKVNCENYCKDAVHLEECLHWGKEKGLIKEEINIEQIKQGLNQFQEGIKNAPPEVLSCLKNVLGEDKFEAMQKGELPFSTDMSQNLGQEIRTCFEKLQEEMMNKIEGDGTSSFQGGDVNKEDFGGFQGGPGGCKTIEECMTYCQSHPEECGMNTGAFPSGTGNYGPSPEELQKYQDLQKQYEGGYPGFDSTYYKY